MNMHNTKAELLTHITELEARLMQGGRDMAALRHKLSVSEGTLALLRTPKSSVTTDASGVIIERHGQRTVKRYPARN